jgi:excisionase family DNA binding protein
MTMSRHRIDDDAPTGAYRRQGAPTAGTPLEGLWDANDVARYLKVSRSWVYHRAEANLFPHVRVGGLLRFDPATVRGFVITKK